MSVKCESFLAVLGSDHTSPVGEAWLASHLVSGDCEPSLSSLVVAKVLGHDYVQVSRWMPFAFQRMRTLRSPPSFNRTLAAGGVISGRKGAGTTLWVGKPCEDIYSHCRHLTCSGKYCREGSCSSSMQYFLTLSDNKTPPLMIFPT